MKHKYRAIYTKIQHGGALDGMKLTVQCNFVTKKQAEEFLMAVREKFEVVEESIIKL